jgi:ParB family chromosome partitioning protein
MAKNLYGSINAANEALANIKKEEVEPNGTSKEQTKEYYKLLPLELLAFDSNIRAESEYTDKDINELAESMKEFGQLQPIRVYEDKKNNYKILFGHRRYFAAKKLGLKELKCIIVPEPTKIDKIYIQAVENEHFKRLSPQEREKYIKVLRDMGKSFEDIARKIGKSVSWVRICSVAGEVNEKCQNMLEDTGIELTTKEAYNLRNATEEQLEEAISAIVEHPENKNVLLRKVNKRTKKKMNVGRKPKETNASIDPTSEMELDMSVTTNNEEEETKLQINHIEIDWSNDQKKFSMRRNSLIDSNDSIAQPLTKMIHHFFTEINYSQVKMVELISDSTR